MSTIFLKVVGQRITTNDNKMWGKSKIINVKKKRKRLWIGQRQNSRWRYALVTIIAEEGLLYFPAGSGEHTVACHRVRFEHGPLRLSKSDCPVVFKGDTVD